MSGAPPRLRLGAKLGLVLFVVIAAALAIVYLVVVPRLESRLVDAKLEELEKESWVVARDVRAASRYRYEEPATFHAANLNARVIVFERLDERTLLALADSSGRPPGDVQHDPVALEAASSQSLASGRVRRGEGELAEVALPASPRTIVLISASLHDTLADVRLVRRTLLAAGGLALLISWLAGYVAASRLTRRIRRLEDAAGRIAAGRFDVPIVDPGGDEIGELARAFDRMRLRLATLDHARREFIANASHELRTPLFSLAGFLELLDDDLDEETRRDFLAEMRAQVERLTRLATDLLDLSRLDAGQLAVEARSIDLAQTARIVADEFRARAEASGHELRVSADGAVSALGDDQRVLQIARILVENALRHTPPETTVEVWAEEAGGKAVLGVHDDGPGIPEEAREQLFERFFRVGGEKASGSGLGLAIASQLAAAMGGEIAVASRPGDTTFRLALPLGVRDLKTAPQPA